MDLIDRSSDWLIASFFLRSIHRLIDYVNLTHSLLYPQTINAVQEKLRKQLEVVVLKDPPTEYEFAADPPSISSFDLEVVKLTAQCVAKNGRDFLAELMDKESKNFQFDFLKPAHSLFDYFTKLVEQYYKVRTATFISHLPSLILTNLIFCIIYQKLSFSILAFFAFYFRCIFSSTHLEWFNSSTMDEIFFT